MVGTLFAGMACSEVMNSSNVDLVYTGGANSVYARGVAGDLTAQGMTVRAPEMGTQQPEASAADPMQDHGLTMSSEAQALAEGLCSAFADAGTHMCLAGGVYQSLDAAAAPQADQAAPAQNADNDYTRNMPSSPSAPGLG